MNLARAVVDIKQKTGINPLDELFVVDIGGGESRRTPWRQAYFQCITRAIGSSRSFGLLLCDAGSSPSSSCVCKACLRPEFAVQGSAMRRSEPWKRSYG